MTNHLGRKVIDIHMEALGQKIEEGRADASLKV